MCSGWAGYWGLGQLWCGKSHVMSGVPQRWLKSVTAMNVRLKLSRHQTRVLVGAGGRASLCFSFFLFLFVWLARAGVWSIWLITARVPRYSRTQGTGGTLILSCSCCIFALSICLSKNTSPIITLKKSQACSGATCRLRAVEVFGWGSLGLDFSVSDLFQVKLLLDDGLQPWDGCALTPVVIPGLCLNNDSITAWEQPWNTNICRWKCIAGLSKQVFGCLLGILLALIQAGATHSNPVH